MSNPKFTRSSDETLWRTIAMTLVGIVVTGLSGWLLIGQKAVGREEVVQMIAADSPYITDRRSIEERLDQNSKLLARLVTDVGEVKVEQARLIERIDALTKRSDK